MRNCSGFLARLASVPNEQGSKETNMKVNNPGASGSVKEEPIEIEGYITTVLPSTLFRVQLDNKHVVLATICGKMRRRWISLTVGDRVKMEMSPYDLDKARITWRIHFYSWSALFSERGQHSLDHPKQEGR